MAGLLDPSRYGVNPDEAWRRIKVRRPSRKTLAVLRELAAWREEQAMERNIPRNWVVRDEVLIEVAQTYPRNVADLSRVRALKPNVAKGRDGEAILSTMKRALASPQDTWPEVPKGRKPLSGHESLVALLSALLRRRCEAHGVAASMVAKRAELDRIATEDEPDVPALRGWRRKIFGADALELCAGRLALTGRKGEVVDVVLSEP
ncbi:MAG: HRDC domain-containing protein, partial [Myxococcota bacterium]|nr:HRDC domain-containing protein [Myxococcota bacterium]